MTDEHYWHCRAVAELQQARNDLHQLRTEFERVSNGLNDAVAEANRWQDAYEHAIDKPGRDTIRGWRQRIDDAETRAEEAESSLAEVRANQDAAWRPYVAALTARADIAEADATDYLDRATRAEEDRDRIEAQARGWKQAAEARTERDCRDCNDVELDRYAAEQRAAMWWDAAKTLYRRQKYWNRVADWRFDALPRLRHRAERAERDVATLQQLLDHLHTTIHGTTTGTEGRS